MDGNTGGVSDTLTIRMGASLGLDLSSLTFEDFGSGAIDNDRIIVRGDNNAETIVGSSMRDEINGEDGDDTLSGFDGNDLLNGAGGLDVLQGGWGDDIYLVDAAGEAVESAGEGFDIVRSKISYTLGDHIEQLELKGGSGDQRHRLGLCQQLIGNADNNLLDGKEGPDHLIGGVGRDTFAFTTRLALGNVDTVADFSPADDTFRLEYAVFRGIGATGVLDASAFHIGPVATDVAHRIVYDAAVGNLYFDPDGSGVRSAVKFAELATGLAMTNLDFRIV